MWHRHIHTPGLTRRVREFLVHWLVFQYPDSTRTVPDSTRSGAAETRVLYGFPAPVPQVPGFSQKSVVCVVYRHDTILLGQKAGYWVLFGANPRPIRLSAAPDRVLAGTVGYCYDLLAQCVGTEVILWKKAGAMR